MEDGRKREIKKVIAGTSLFLLAGVLILTVFYGSPYFGEFPDRKVGDLKFEDIGRALLERAPEEVKGANVVTDILWDYRGYDTLGEATVIFSAVAGVAALLGISREEASSRKI